MDTVLGRWSSRAWTVWFAAVIIGGLVAVMGALAPVVLFGIVGSGVLTLAVSRIRGVTIAQGIIIAITLQNVVVPLLFRLGLVGSLDATFLLAVNDAGVSVAWLGYVVWGTRRHRRLMVWEWIGLALLVLVAAYFPLSDGASLFQKVDQARQILTPYLYVTAGFILLHTDRANPPEPDTRFSRVLRGYIGWSVAGVILGYLFTYMGGVRFWQALHIGYYWIVVKHVTFLSIDSATGLPGNFIRAVGTTHDALRYIGPWGDPLATGYALFPVALMLFYVWKHKQPRTAWWLALTVVAIVLTDTRAAVVALVVGAVYLAWRRELRLVYPLAFLAIGLLLLVLTHAHTLLATYGGSGGSTQGHLNALVSDVGIIPRILGVGLGVTTTSPQLIGMGGENTLFQLYSQTGLVSGVLFYGFLAAVVVELTRYCRSSVRWYLIGAVLGYVATSVVSTNIMTDTSTGAFWLLVGAYIAAEVVDAPNGIS